MPPATLWPKLAGGGARGNKSEGLLQEVHRRHPSLGGGGQKRRVDRKRPWNKPFFGAIVPPRNAIYRRGGGSTLHDPQEYSSYEGVLEPEGPGIWFDPEVGNDPAGRSAGRAQRVELRLTDQDCLAEAGGARGQGGDDPLASVWAQPKAA